MHGSLVVASNSGSASQSTPKPVQIIKIVKPAAGQTDIFHASFDGTVKIDFTAIANEKITFCHDKKNQSLHIIFLDGSQAIIEPFFDSMAVMSNLVFEMTPGQVLNSAEFASQFPITTDQSVLPAGAEGQQSGAEFNDPSVDPLPPNVPLALLPPEELPPIVFHGSNSSSGCPRRLLRCQRCQRCHHHGHRDDGQRGAGERSGPAGDRQQCGIEQRDLQRFDHGIRRHRTVHLYTEQPGDRQPRHAGAESANGTYTYTLTSPFDTTPDSTTTAAQTSRTRTVSATR